MVARALLALLVAAFFAAAPASASDSAGPRARPHTGHTTTTFIVGFTAPEAAGHHGVSERSYDVSASTRQRRGCASVSDARVDSAAKGERVHVRLRPTGAARWCRGVFRGTISIVDGPFCEPGQVCPLFATRERTIGHFRFRVR